MDIQQSYDLWSGQYDSDENKTRDLEAKALRSILQNVKAKHCLELGCGTGKNTGWLQTICSRLIAVDFSEGMLSKAKQKILSGNVEFMQADLTNAWHFKVTNFDLIIFSLVLEHIENLEPIFQEASRNINPGGLLYIGELHPCKQYQGSQARFQVRDSMHHPACFTHHVSSYINSGVQNGFKLENLFEFFDEDDKSGTPRILSILFRKL